MPQLCTLMPPGGAAAAEWAGGLRAVWGACNGRLFVGSPSPGGARQRARAAPRSRDTTVRASGPPGLPQHPRWAQRPGAARREQQRRLPGRAGALPALGPSRLRLCPLPAGSPAPPRPAPSVCSAAAAAGTDTVSAGRESAETPVSNMGKVGRESVRYCPAPPRAPSPPGGCNPVV